MNELKKLQCKDVEKGMIISLNEVLDTLEYTIQDVKNRNISYGFAKKVANKYVPIMLRNSNRLREFRLFMNENGIETSKIDLSDRVNKMVDFLVDNV